MFDINLGIDADLSGFDNIRIRALLLGLSPNAIERHLPEIVEFTELGEYLDMPGENLFRWDDIAVQFCGGDVF